MVLTDAPTAVNLSRPIEVLSTTMEVVDLGKIETKDGRQEIVRMVRLAGKNNQGVWVGLFVPDDGGEGWDKWLEGSGMKDNVVTVDLDPIRKERLQILSITNLPPIFIFNLAMNTDIDLTEIVEHYTYVKGPAMMTIGSDHSEQGKSTTTAIEAGRWGGSELFTADIFAKDNGAQLAEILRENGWDGQDVREAFELISVNREWEKMPGVEFGDYLNLMWHKWTNSLNFMLIDLPGMRKEDGRNTRLTDGMDLLKFMIPHFEIPSYPINKENGFDAQYYEKVSEVYYSTIRDTWNLDKQRVAGLRKLLE